MSALRQSPGNLPGLIHRGYAYLFSAAETASSNDSSCAPA